MEIVCQNVSKVFKIKDGLFKTKKLTVVKDFNYCIKQGEIIALMGLASSGKSTIVNLLSGRALPTSGRVLINGEENFAELKSVCEVISSFENKNIMFNDSVYNNLAVLGSKKGINSFDVEKRIVELRDSLELGKIINKKLCELDSFDLIKVNVGISMISSPQVLFFDNALLGLDAITKNMLLKILKRVNKEFKTTIVIASVDLSDIEKICKRVSIVNDGKIVADGEYDCLKEKYWKYKCLSIVFNKSFNVPKGEFVVLEHSDYFLKIKIDFSECNFASLLNQLDVNSILDINISSILEI